jgi:hypothetical protein
MEIGLLIDLHILVARAALFLLFRYAKNGKYSLQKFPLQVLPNKFAGHHPIAL